MITVTRTQPDDSCRKAGLNLVRQKQTGRLLVRGIKKDSLFSLTAIQAGQEVVTINGQSVKDVPSPQIIELLQQHATVTVVTQIPKDDSYDQDTETCTFGHFVLNPFWYLYTKVRGNTKNRSSHMQKMLWMSKLQIALYLTSFYFVWWITFTKALPLNNEIQQQQQLSQGHIWFVHLLFVAAVTSWVAATMVAPGSITLDSMHKFDNYSYDGVLYQKDNICPTLNIRKLARSKYDRYSQQHVPRFDHFCTWLGNTIGEENYRFFMIFLAIHAVMVTYGIWVFYHILYGITLEEGGLTWVQAATAHPSLPFGIVFNLLASLPTDMFFLFHVQLIQRGMTTNEYYKWQDIKALQRKRAASSCQDIERNGSTTKPTTTNNNKNRHIYDLGGFLGNLHEVFFPRSLRREVRLGLNKEL